MDAPEIVFISKAGAALPMVRFAASTGMQKESISKTNI